MSVFTGLKAIIVSAGSAHNKSLNIGSDVGSTNRFTYREVCERERGEKKKR
jgi:hypothetical protein